MAYIVHATDVVEKDGKIIGGIVDAVLASLNNPADKAALKMAINAWNMAANVARETTIAENRKHDAATARAAKDQAVAEAIAEKDARIAELESQIAALTPAPVPEGVTVRTSTEILMQVTPEEYQRIWSASQQSPDVSRWLNLLLSAPTVRSDSEQTVAGCAAMVQLGLFTAERVLEIFGVALE